MINICFDASVCGAMKYGLREKPAYIYDGLCYGKIHPDYFDETRKLRIDRIYSLCSKRERNEIFKEEKICDENTIGINKFAFKFSGDEGSFSYTNEQGDKVILFGIDKNVFGKFP